MCVHHISSAGVGNVESDDADSRGLKNGAALRIVTAFVKQSPSGLLARSSFSSSLYVQHWHLNKFSMSSNVQTGVTISLLPSYPTAATQMISSLHLVFGT